MPKDMTSIRYARLSEIMKLLQSRLKVTHDELISRGQYSNNRTLQNDLRYLRETWGAEIRYDARKKIYVLDHAGTFVINLRITPQEIGALTSGLKIAGHFLPHMKEPAASLWEKLSAYVPHELITEGEALARMTTILSPVAKVNAENFNAILEAIREKRSVSIKYKSPNKNARRWTISPYDFYFRGISWYLIACNHKFKSLSIYRAGRIQKVTTSSESYINPDEAGYSDEYISSAWYVTPGPKRYKIKLKISEYLATSIRELAIHPTQEIHECDDGGIIFTAEVPDLDEVARWVMAGAPGVKVIEPEELRLKVRDFCCELLSGTSSPDFDSISHVEDNITHSHHHEERPEERN